MARCEVCGNDYEQSFEVHLSGQVHACASCATAAGVAGVRDHA